ncbi:MAG: twin-arginine translocation signal domain-containing protein [Actinomycetota bacterium]|nr:twin-arginine translocation signal domain-containing protein [Actinomycetota bacterium]
MAKYDKEEGVKQGLSRRDFLKTGAAAAAVGAAGLDFAVAPSMAAAATVDATYHTTCPYCSASCGQLVDVDSSGNVLDVYGDFRSPFNEGGLCAKGAGAYQLVTNKRRVGAFTGAHSVNSVFEAKAPATAFSAVPAGWTGPIFAPASHTYAGGVAYWRLGNGSWSPVPLDVAMQDIAEKMVTARGTVNALNGYNSKSVAFFGSSHMNNEQNYTYRKIIATFGTSNVEHQARI